MYFRAYKPKVSVWHQIIEFQIFLWKDKNKRAMVFFLIVRSNPHRRRTTLYFWWKQRINCNFRLQNSIEEISPKTEISPKLIRLLNWNWTNNEKPSNYWQDLSFIQLNLSTWNKGDWHWLPWPCICMTLMSQQWRWRTEKQKKIIYWLHH